MEKQGQSIFSVGRNNWNLSNAEQIGLSVQHYPGNELVTFVNPRYNRAMLCRFSNLEDRNCMML